MEPVVGREKQSAADRCQSIRPGSGAACVQIDCQYRAISRTIALPQFLPACSVIGREEEHAVDVDQLAGPPILEGAALRMDVGDHVGAVCRAVGPPEFPAVCAVVGMEVCRAVDVGQTSVAEIGKGKPVRVDVLDLHRAFGSAVAGPEFAPVDVVVGDEEQCFVDVDQPARPRRFGSREDIYGKRSAFGRPVTAPEFPAVCAVVGHKVQQAVLDRELAVPPGQRVGLAGGDVRHLGGAVRRAVGPPQLQAVNAVTGYEQQGVVHAGQ